LPFLALEIRCVAGVYVMVSAEAAVALRRFPVGVEEAEEGEPEEDEDDDEIDAADRGGVGRTLPV
jgi:hypothetical protein